VKLDHQQESAQPEEQLHPEMARGQPGIEIEQSEQGDLRRPGAEAMYVENHHHGHGQCPQAIDTGHHLA